MQCVNVNVIMREFVLARHLPDHEDVAHEEGEGAGWEEQEVGPVKGKVPKSKNFQIHRCHVNDSHTHTQQLLC